jgi:hypothetical protein
MFPRLNGCVVATMAFGLLGFAASSSAQILERAPEPVFAGSVPVDGARPKVMIPLYGTLAALQGADAWLTMKGLDAGVHERNPLMRGNRGVMTLTKAISMATTVAIAEKMWKRNRAAAIATLVAANAVTAVVVARNAQIVRGARH